MLVAFLQNLGVEKQSEYKVGFTTYSFYKRKDNVIEVDCTRDGWLSATINEIPQSIDNEMKFLHNLDWS